MLEIAGPTVLKLRPKSMRRYSVVQEIAGPTVLKLRPKSMRR
jgi:hypothetical protein